MIAGPKKVTYGPVLYYENLIEKVSLKDSLGQ